MRGRASAISSSSLVCHWRKTFAYQTLIQAGSSWIQSALAGGRAGEHPQGHAIGVADVGKPAGQGRVEGQPSVVLKLEQEIDDVGDRDRADAEVHPKIRGHPLHRLPRSDAGDRTRAQVEPEEARP